MTKKEILDDLFQRRRFNIKPGLERTLELAACCSNPQKKIRTIHIAGTNGKGSTAAMTASALYEAGYKTGLYTSPHIKQFNERVVINGTPINDAELVHFAQPLLAKADEIGATFFEITTVMAFQYFAENKVDFAVIECGMGGRYDSTNIITPMISCITSIADDHKDYLGDTIEKIAYEKAGIIKNNIPVVIAHNEDNIVEVIKAEAEKHESNASIVDDIIKKSYYALDNKTLKAKHKFDYKGNSWKVNIPFIGLHQSYNLASTVVLCSEIGNLLGIEPSRMKDYAISGFENVMKNFPMHGRTEIHNTEPILAVDGGHNPAAAKMLANSFKGVVENFTIIFAAMHDKDSKAMLNELKSIANNFIFPQLENTRAEKNTVLCNHADDLGIENYELVATAQAAYDMVSKKNAPLLITGSFYLIGEIEL